MSLGVGDPILDSAILPDVLAPYVGVGRQKRRKDGRLGPLVDGERALVARHVSVHVARMNMVHDVVGVGILFIVRKSRWVGLAANQLDRHPVHPVWFVYIEHTISL